MTQRRSVQADFPFTDIDPESKASQTPTHVFFLNGPFSQWHPSRLEQRLSPDGDVLTFNCAEQYMMGAKAHLFADQDTLDRIMAVQQGADWRDAPKTHKALGRQVRNFDPSRWNAEARAIVLRGNWAKFSQNAHLAAALLATGDKIIVECADYDPVWDVALAWNDPAIADPRNWRGTNWLGTCLSQVRNALARPHAFDPWTARAA